MGSSKRHQRGVKHPQPTLVTRQRQTRSKGRALESDPALNNQLLTEQLRALGLYAAPTLGDGNCLFRALSDQLHGTPAHHATLRRDVCDWIEQHKARYEPFCDDERGIDTHLSCMRQQGKSPLVSPPRTYGGHMELSAFAHMTGRNVKVVQPGLVYVIEAAPDAAPPPPAADDEDDDDGLDPDELPTLSRRARRRAGKGKEASAFPATDDDHDDADTGPPLGPVYVAYHDWEHFSSIRNLRGPHTGPPEVRETPAADAPSSSPARKTKPYAKTRSSARRSVPSSKPTSAVSALQDRGTPAPGTPSQIPLPSSRSPSPVDNDGTPSSSISARLIHRRAPSPARSFRSPKRTFDESSCSSRGDPSSELSEDHQHAAAKRTRSRRASPSRHDDADDDMVVDADTPELSPGTSNLSSPLTSEDESDEPLPAPPPEPVRHMSKRERKKLGLPKARPATVGGKSSAGKIVIPGGRYKAAVSPTKAKKAQEDPAIGTPESGEAEWVKNGVGRMDVRGFRELKI
ncbi:cysteine proteinase [Punctularia strigosozonata HHB-11173 SS5]|uniref:cysteine proteinase n=1 Tax=Punctularia strigosozonata (strain HHB-11173) TaxID=741275 RepID=UPI00044174EB|nr:cysteine proteinase [Punctularia strigosozonata HHB-11173 SS5]EIN05764.1 cysteine proteinase [Punctularia strigosozonata HHB-11173 SS5]